MSKVNIDWGQIRPLNGSRTHGFEELCAQLARAECPPGTRFERKGIPDAGVDCYAVLHDANEWGWQAKYFHTLGDSQWSQIDESVETALEKHPQLARYYVCVPVDRSDARIAGQRSARERWDKHQHKWNAQAAACGMTVEFVYWGSHELLERLARPENVGKVRFWFDIRRFDQAWFEARLQEAHKTAGPRYSPELNVELPISAKFEAFGRTPRFFDQLKTHAREIRGKLRYLGHLPSTPFDSELVATSSTLSRKVGEVLTELGSIALQPAGDLPFREIANLTTAAEKAAEELEDLLVVHEERHDDERRAAGKGDAHSAYVPNAFRDHRYHLRRLAYELRVTREALEDADRIAGSALMLLKGAAGTGKTHLLCDLAHQRISDVQPTVLLMGQQFISNEPPRRQALQLLDLGDLTTDEFVGALEAAAQATDSRALVVVDALNEGAGRRIWPTSLAAFVEHLARSPWIGIILSVRTSYEETIVPQEVRGRAVHIVHDGFAGHEYDAVQAYFSYYNLQLPSTPLLAPEFSSPFYLKTLCVGLSETGQRTLPRGFQGITFASRLFLNAVNKRLSERLGFDERSELVHKAVRAFAEAMVASGDRWLPLADARHVVDSLLPGRNFEESLYRGLVTEGVLAEDLGLGRAKGEEVVYFGYDRLGDHLVAEAMLRSIGVRNSGHKARATPALRFILKVRLWLNLHVARNKQWRSLCHPRGYFPIGVLEALCVQIPERTGLELPELYRGVRERSGIRDAFRQSLVWRAPEAFSAATLAVLDDFIGTEQDLFETLDALLTVATLPKHPLNALFLNQRLRKDAMPDRDSWWSVFLHHAWETQGAVDRLVNWAWSVKPDVVLDDDTVDLCAIALSWMLTVSNRFLRDRATKALVSLLSGRLQAVTRLVELFTDVDDPYVAERIYAVAYSTSMLGQEADEVGLLASCVYERVFARGAPPPNILLRDYARGVVERALYLGADINVDAKRIRPPYESQWPPIPTEDEVKLLLPDWSRGSHDSGDLEWARNRIGSSVMSDDFAWYVIGTNSSSKGWLSLRLDEPPWKSHEERLVEVVSTFSDAEKSAWQNFEQANDALIRLTPIKVIVMPATGEEQVDSDGRHGESSDEVAPNAELAEARLRRDSALAALESALTPEHAEGLRIALKARSEAMNNRERAPRFDLGIIQRYVLWRVFNLGWTTERFGEFDRFTIGFHGRAASKAERFGKKYQWIAYHEILALIADHFQYREAFRGDEGAREYDGPWQENLRDIDPSCTLRAAKGGTSWSGHSPAWWGSARFESWESPQDPSDWATNCDDLPKVEDLLLATRPSDGSSWVNLQGYLNWQQSVPPHLETTDVERRDLWYMFTGYLIHQEDTQPFMEWAEQVDLSGHWMVDPPEINGMFLGEHAWSPAARYFEQPYFGAYGWTELGRGCPVEIRFATVDYIHESGGFDCSLDETCRLRLPVRDLLGGLNLRWNGHGAEFVDAQGRVVVFDPTAFEEGPSALLVRKVSLMEFLAANGYTICWAVRGEKRVIGPGFSPDYHVSLRLTGAYALQGDVPRGILKCFVDHRDGASGEVSQELLAVIRTED